MTYHTITIDEHHQHHIPHSRFPYWPIQICQPVEKTTSTITASHRITHPTPTGEQASQAPGKGHTGDKEAREAREQKTRPKGSGRHPPLRIRLHVSTFCSKEILTHVATWPCINNALHDSLRGATKSKPGPCSNKHQDCSRGR